MPSRNIIKLYRENTFYHVYNRGAAKQEIFIDDKDFRVLLSYFKLYLTSPEELSSKIEQCIREKDAQKVHQYMRAHDNNFYGQVEIHCFALMPNHFHLALRQKSSHAMPAFMRTVFTRYGYYFNQRHERSGHLFQGVYKARAISNDESFRHLSKYIHLNSRSLEPKHFSHYAPWNSWRDYPYSSCHYYLDDKNSYPDWIAHTTLDSYFTSVKDHLKYLEGGDDCENLEDILE